MKLKLLQAIIMLSKCTAYGFVVQVLFFNLLLANTGSAQKTLSVREVQVVLNAGESKVRDVFNQIERNSDFRFAIDKNDLKSELNQKVGIEGGRNTVSDILIKISKESGIKFRQVNNNITVSKLGEEKLLEQIDVVFLADQEISGKITDENGQGLPGASIVIKGTSNGTTSDLEGNYKLGVPENATVVISFVGYVTQEIEVGSQSVIDLQMRMDAGQLDEVVVVGYGTQKKKLNTGANQQIKSKDLTDRLKFNALQSLQGQAPGVNVMLSGGQPGKSAKVFIRGLGTNGNTTPLFIVDGVQTDNINYLNSFDIETIDVLKDAASSTIYGSRAANGVILITTKKGNEGENRVTLDVFYGWQTVGKKTDLLNAQEYAMIMNEKFENSGDTPFFTGSRMDQVNAMGEGTDWIELMFKDNVATENYSLGFSGGSKQTTFSTGLSYTKQGGVLGGSDLNNLRRISFRINTENRFLDGALKIGENITASMIDQRLANESFVKNALNAPPILAHVDSDGNYVDNTTGLLADFGGVEVANPFALMELDAKNNKSSSFRVLGNFFTEIKPLKDKELRIKSSIGVNYVTNNSRRFIPKYPDLGAFHNSTIRPNNAVNQSSTSNLQWVLTNTISYGFEFGDHRFDAVAGSEMQRTDGISLEAANQKLIFDDFEHAYIDNAQGQNTESVMTMSGAPFQHRLLSYFGRVSYNFREKFLFNATLRSDGSSNFSKVVRRGYFPSASAGWILTNEPFLENTTGWLSTLKLRASWGQNGNQNVPAFRYLATLSSNSLYSLGTMENGFVAPGAQLDRLANPGLEWEKSEQTDIGVDASFYEGKLVATIDYYHKSTKGWLISPPISSIIGLGAPWINGGNVINKGVEFSLTSRGKISNLGYSVNVNGAYNNNSVTDVPNDIIHGPGSGLWDNSLEFQRVQTGFPMYYYWMLETDGIFQNIQDVENYEKDGNMIQPSARAGNLRYVDQNNDGVINDEDRINVGDPFPDFTYGINLNLDYQGFDLMINANGVAGAQMVQGYYNYGRFYQNYTTEVLERWHGEGTSNRYPRNDKEHTNWVNNSDIFVYQTDFLKIGNITLGYDLARLINVEGISQFRLYTALLNGLTFTKYNGMDPEHSGSESGHIDVTGLDRGFVPNPRTIMIGTNIKF